MAPDVVLLTTSEIAELFRVHPGTVRRWVADGQLAAIELPGGDRRTKRYRRSDVEAILAGRNKQQSVTTDGAA